MTLETFTRKVNELGRTALEDYVLNCDLADLDSLPTATDADLRALILTEPGDIASLADDADLLDFSDWGL